MANKEKIGLLIGAFRDKGVMLCDIGTIDDISDMPWNEIIYKIRAEFELYLQYQFDENLNTILCRIMFIRESECKKTWYHFGKNNGVAPISFKWMTTVLEYDINGDINEICDE